MSVMIQTRGVKRGPVVHLNNRNFRNLWRAMGIEPEPDGELEGVAQTDRIRAGIEALRIEEVVSDDIGDGVVMPGITEDGVKEVIGELRALLDYADARGRRVVWR